MSKLRIATRGSELALAQAEYVEERLQRAGYETEKLILKTTGDVNLAPFALASGDDRKGLFTKEIEDALLSGEADVAVHSYKDLPSVTVPELVIGAIPQRIDGRDFLLFKKSNRVQESFPFVGNEALVGTSSIRRRSQFSHLCPGIRVQELRGNVPTRVKKLFEPGGPEAILLSGAGVERLTSLGRFLSADLISQLDIEPVDFDLFVPAPAQGTLAVQCRADDATAIEALALIHDPELAEIIGIERGVLAALEGGCHLPLGAHAVRVTGACEAKVYLGVEFAKTRYSRSIQITRRHTNAGQLRQFVIQELTAKDGGAPIVVFGRRSRVEELRTRHGVKGFGVLEPQSTTEGRQAEIARSLEGSNFVALFSAEGVRTFSTGLGDLFLRSISREDLIWGVPGHRTAELLQKKGVPGERILVGEDGTAAGLARRFLAEREKSVLSRGRVAVLTAEEGRDEFPDILKSAGVACERHTIYRTRRVELSQSDLASLGQDAYLLFGSPSSFETFAASLARYDHPWSEGWRVCSIGQTTSNAIRHWSGGSGPMEPYLTAHEPDYDAVISEILGR